MENPPAEELAKVAVEGAAEAATEETPMDAESEQYEATAKLTGAERGRREVVRGADEQLK